MIGNFFLYDPAGDGFQIFPTMEQRDVAAKMAIENSMVDGYWSDDVLEIVVGQITGRAVKTNAVKRPENLDENSEDEEGKVWNSDMDEKHDVEIMPVNGPLRLGKRERKMSDEEFDRKIQQLRNEGYDDFADAINGLRAEITAERQASEREVADGLEFRNHIAALLPESWYTALPVEDRIRLLVEQWRKLHVSHVELTAERDGLRKQFHTQAEQRDFVGKLVDNMPHAQIAAEFGEFKAEVADALAALRKKVVALQLPVGHVEYSQYDYGVGDALNCVDTTIAKLGLAPKEKQ